MNFTQPIVPLLVLMIPAFGQMREHTDPQLSCQANWKSGKLERFCEIREQKMPATQRLELLASPNGGVNVEMSGDRWRGVGLDAQTVNGGVNLSLPLNYSAKILASTQNGGMRSEFPVTGDSRHSKNLEFNVGSGGPPIRIATRNGGVSIRKKAI